MKRLLLFVVVLVLAVPCVGFGQAQTAPPKPAPPKPGPEVQQLAAYLGTWQCGYENKTGTQEKGEFGVSCDWASGGFLLACKGTLTASNDFTMVWGYKTEEKEYWSFRYFSNGSMDFSRGWIDGSTLNFVFENAHSGGKAVRRQVKQTFESPTLWTYQWERSVEGAPWVTTQVGKCTKVK